MSIPEPNFRKKIQKEFYTMVRYGLVGLSNTAFFAALAWILSRRGWHYAFYTACSYLIAFVYSFIMNSIFTFRQKSSLNLSVFIRFVLVALVLMGAVQIIQWLIIEGAKLPEIVGVGLGMIFYTGVGYVINRMWVFRS